MSYKEMCAAQVAWYRKHGRFPKERIRRDGGGVEYVVGDWSFNHRDRSPKEYVDREINAVEGMK